MIFFFLSNFNLQPSLLLVYFTMLIDTGFIVDATPFLYSISTLSNSVLHMYMQMYISLWWHCTEEPVITNQMSLSVYIFSFHSYCKFIYGGKSLTVLPLSYLNSFWRKIKCIRKLKSRFCYVSLLWFWPGYT